MTRYRTGIIIAATIAGLTAGEKFPLLTAFSAGMVAVALTLQALDFTSNLERINQPHERH